VSTARRTWPAHKGHQGIEAAKECDKRPGHGLGLAVNECSGQGAGQQDELARRRGGVYRNSGQDQSDDVKISAAAPAHDHDDREHKNAQNNHRGVQHDYPLL
jgi:hypothetical protein